MTASPTIGVIGVGHLVRHVMPALVTGGHRWGWKRCAATTPWACGETPPMWYQRTSPDRRDLKRLSQRAVDG